MAVSPNPGGPYKTTHYNVTLPGKGRTGDYDIFVDDNGTAYHVRTGKYCGGPLPLILGCIGFDVVKLNDEFTGGTEHVSSFTTPKSSEGPGNSRPR